MRNMFYQAVKDDSITTSIYYNGASNKLLSIRIGLFKLQTGKLVNVRKTAVPKRSQKPFFSTDF